MRRGTSEHAMFMFLFLLQFFAHYNSLPLSTSARWIVDESTGERVKLACVNWVSHLPTMIAEGLEKRPINAIAKVISADGFNCVRFTWATFMFTRRNYSSLTVSHSFDLHNLASAKHGIAKNNPRFLYMKVVDLHVAVVKALRKNNLMVVLDNHVSKPKWCCRSNDGNVFFGDIEFDPAEWVRGLAAVARIYRNNSALDGCLIKYDNASFIGVEDMTVAMKKCGPSDGYNAEEMSCRDAVLAGLSGAGGPFRVGASEGFRVARCVGDLSAAKVINLKCYKGLGYYIFVPHFN